MHHFKNLVVPELRAHPEFQSALVRLGLWLLLLVYVGGGIATGRYQVERAFFQAAFAAYLVIFLGLTLSIVLRPEWPARRYVALMVDVSATSMAIFLTREAISPFYLLYIWIFISYGTRYGERPLRLASLLAVLAYSLLLLEFHEWSRHAFEAGFFLLLLILLPLYQYSLLRKVHAAHREVERANRAKQDFLATMTHELHTPLSGIIGMARLLESTPLGSEQQDCVHAIAASAEMLHALIGDLLDLVKIGTDQPQLESAPFDPGAAVLEVCIACAHQAVEQGLELVCRIDPQLPATVLGDGLRLRQILLHLVSNAVKFTERGEVVVSLKAEPEDVGMPRPHILLEVCDTGIGIARHQLEHIFDGFWQADRSTTRRYGGAGIGTTIARQLTLLMGGSIGVESEEGKGSRFWVRLPLPVDGAAARPPLSELVGRCALVYETNAVARQALGETCTALGLEWRPLEGLGRLETLRAAGRGVDLAIIADSPAGEDLAGIRDLLQHALGPLPILFLTCVGCRPPPTGGGCLCLGKPFLPQVLAQRLRGVLRAGPGAALPAAPPAVGLPGSMFPGLEVLVAEDNAIAAKVMLAFLSRQGHRVTHTRDGPETLALVRGRSFDIAFLDLRMPGIDGLDFSRIWRAEEPPDRHLPLVALTANATDEVRESALAAGMDAFLTKPVTPEELEAVIRRYCPRGGSGH